MSRADQHTIQSRIEEARSDPNVLSMNVVDTMRKYGLSYYRVARLRRDLIREALSEGDSEKILRAQTQKDFQALRNRVVRAETRYPGLHRRLVTEKNMAAIGRDFGITRERIRQLHLQFEEFVDEADESVSSALDEIEEAAD